MYVVLMATFLGAWRVIAAESAVFGRGGGEANAKLENAV
jgi:hypothetical protein